MAPSEASTSGAQEEASPNAIPHMPRKRAAAPRFDHLPEFRATPEPAPAPAPAVPVPDDAYERVMALKEPRIGPFFVRYSVWAGGAAIAYTYLTGFRALYAKDRVAWTNTFRQRMWIMSPLIAMYVTGANLIPMPFRSSIEQALGRPAITLLDLSKAERKLREEKKAQESRADKAASDAFADKVVAAAKT